jgi:hypothetical protein
VDYLQVALQVADEEVTEARALATVARVRAYGEFLLLLIPIRQLYVFVLRSYRDSLDCSAEGAARDVPPFGGGGSFPRRSLGRRPPSGRGL